MAAKKKNPWADEDSYSPAVGGGSPAVDDPARIKVVNPFALIDEPRPTPAPPRRDRIQAVPGMWEGEDALAQGLTLGAYKPARAAGYAARKGFEPGNYDYAKQLLDRAQEEYEFENPATAAGLEFGGAAVSTMVPLGVASHLAKAIPYAGKWISGTAGYGRVGEALPGALNTAKRFGSQGTAGAIQGGTGAAMMSGLSEEDFLDDVTRGTIVGGPTGALLGTGSNALMNFVRGPVVPYDRAKLGKWMLDRKIPIRGDQMLEKSAHSAGQRAAMEREYARLIGEDLGPDEFLSEEVMARANARISSMFNDAAGQNGFYVDDALLHRLGEVEGLLRNPRMATALGNEANEVQQMIADIRTMGGATWNRQFGRWDPPSRNDFWTPNGSPGDEVRRSGGAPGEPARLGNTGPRNLPSTDIDGAATGNAAEDLYRQRGDGTGPQRVGGDVFQALTEKDSRLWKLQHEKQGTVRNFSNAIRDALEDALERGSTAEGVEMIRDARRQYRNMLLLEPVVRKSEVGASPTRMPNIVDTRYNKLFPNNPYDADENDLNQLVRGSRTFFEGPEKPGFSPWASRRAEKEYLGSSLLGTGAGGAIPTMMMMSGGGDLATVIGGTALGTVAGLGAKAYREGPTFARRIAERSMMADRRRIPSALQPGLNNLTRGAILAESELFR